MGKKDQKKIAVDYLKAVIDAYGSRILSDKPWEVYRGLCAQEEIQPLYAMAVLMTMLSGLPLRVNVLKREELEADIRESAGLNEELTAEMAAVYALLFSVKNKKEWKENKLKGFVEFCENEWMIIWGGFCEWNTGTIKMDCMADAWIRIRVDSAEIVQKDNRKLLEKNPFISAQQLLEIYQEQIREILNEDFEAYCTEDDYYEPVLDDYRGNMIDLAGEYLKKHGFCVLDWGYKAFDGGFEPADSEY